MFQPIIAPPSSRKFFDATLSVAQASITIPVPSGGKNLRISGQIRGVAVATQDQLLARFNLDATATDYNTQYTIASGASVSAGENIGTANGAQIANVCAANSPAAEYGSFELFVPNYLNTSFNHPWESRSVCLTSLTSGGVYTVKFSGYWLQGAAITSLLIFCSTGNLGIGSAVQAYLDY